MSDVLKNLSEGMAATVEQAGLSIVRVEARRRLPATGIVWSADGIILTSHHVVERDESIQIGLHDGSTLPATLVGRDPNNDVAVLRVQGTLTPANWAQPGEAKVGHLVLALGRPMQNVQATLGVVSALVGKAQLESEEEGHREGRRRRRMGWGRALAEGYLQTDVVMYPGFSGGPLVSAGGSFYGMNTSGFPRGISLTVPVTALRSSVDALLTHGRVKQGYLGVGVQTVKLPSSVAEKIGRESGVLIISVEADSPAGAANLLVGDIIVALDGEAVEDMNDLLGALSGERVGKSVPVDLVRGGQQHQLSVTVGERS